MGWLFYFLFSSVFFKHSHFFLETSITADGPYVVIQIILNLIRINVSYIPTGLGQTGPLTLPLNERVVGYMDLILLDYYGVKGCMDKHIQK